MKLINLLVNMVTDHLSNTFAALADPTRRAILARLAEGEASVKQLAEPFDISAPAVTKHLKVLQRAGLITQSRQAQWRPCRLEAKPLAEVAGWVDQYRRFWVESFDRLDSFLAELQEQRTPKNQKENKSARKK
jgi:DNA-binding transcriptional ArsR family regulator